MWASPPTNPPALSGIPLFKGDFRANNVRPYGGNGLPFEKGMEFTICVPGNEDSPEGETGSLSAVTLPFSLRWIGG